MVVLRLNKYAASSADSLPRWLSGERDAKIERAKETDVPHKLRAFTVVSVSKIAHR